MISRYVKNLFSLLGVLILVVGDIVELLVLDVLVIDVWESWGGMGVWEGGYFGFFVVFLQVLLCIVVFQVGVQLWMVDIILDVDVFENFMDLGYYLVVGEVCQGSD